MTRKHVGRNAGTPGRISVSRPDLDQLALEAGDAVDVDIGDDTAVVNALTHSKEFERSLVVSSTN